MAEPTLSPVRPQDLADVAGALARAGDERGGDVVDEAELARLQGRRRLDNWHAVVARGGDEVVGYAAVVEQDSAVAGDLVSLAGPEVIAPLLAWQREQAGDRDLSTWLRFATEPELEVVRRSGFEVRRQLGVLGRDLDDPDVAQVPDGLAIRPVTVDDLDGVLAVLLDAYDGTDNAGWTQEEMAHRRAYPWYRDEDLLVAVTDDGRVAGIHWTKRRTQDTGEVYNLAIAPWAQRRGLGRALLTAGMAHLADVGASEILLWVDRSNTKAVALYDSKQFTTRWDDVALGLAASRT